MIDTVVQCPKCGAELEVSDAITARIRADLERSIQRDGELRPRQALQEAEAQIRFLPPGRGKVRMGVERSIRVPTAIPAFPASRGKELEIPRRARMSQQSSPSRHKNVSPSDLPEQPPIL
jgi:hypothetical protein